MAKCGCVAVHRPKVHEYNEHHILPRSWGGITTVDNMVTLCPTAHASVHTLLNFYVKYHGELPPAVRHNFSPFIRDLAAQAWLKRPSEHPPWTTHEG